MGDPTGPNIGSGDDDEVDFDTAVVRYFDGELDSESLARFNQSLRTDPVKRDRFVEFCLTRAGLIEQLKEEAEYDRTLRAGMDDGPEADLNETMVSPALVDLPDDPFDTDEIILPPAIRPPVKTKFYRWVSVAALVIAVIGIGVAVSSLLRSPSAAHTPVAVVTPDGSPVPAADPRSATSQESATTAPSVAGVGRIEQAIDARWDPATDPEPLQAGELNPGLHHLDGGVVRIELGADRSAGASLVIQGPAVFQVDSQGLVRLWAGKLSAKVPHTGVPFAVMTPDLKAVDLGTEFGLEVTPGHQTYLNVFDGRVRAEVTDSGGTVSSRVLSASDAVVVASGSKQFAPAVSQPLAFVRLAEMVALARAGTTPLQRWAGFSKSLRLDPDLVAYYPFDNKDEAPARLLNRAAATAGRFDADFSTGDTDGTVAPVWSTGRWPGKPALSFGQTAVSSVNFTDVPDLIPAKAITLCVWLRRTETARPVHFLHGTIGRTGEFNLELMGTDSKTSLNLEARRAYLSWGDKDTPSGEVLPDGTGWYFLSVTSSVTGTTDFYINGMKVSSGRNRGAVPMPLEKLTLGAPVHGSDADYRDYFRGSVDELMIFKRVLSDSEIRRLYTAGGAY